MATAWAPLGQDIEKLVEIENCEKERDVIPSEVLVQLIIDLFVDPIINRIWVGEEGNWFFVNQQ